MPTCFLLHRASSWTPCLFLATVLCFFSAGIAATPCSSSYYDESVTVKRIVDGDTLQLADGRKLRLIGINTPELKHLAQTSEPLSTEARQMLQTLAKPGNRIKLRWGAEKKDRYRRLLAHVFSPDGRNLNAALLKAGMAAAIQIPPNLWAYQCYVKAEKTARKQRLGIWNHPYFKPLDAHQLPSDSQGFHFVRGRLTRIGKSKTSLWLNLGEHFALRIHKKELSHFRQIHFDQLIDKQLTARGWIYAYKGQWYMNLHHPASLEIK